MKTQKQFFYRDLSGRGHSCTMENSQAKTLNDMVDFDGNKIKKFVRESCVGDVFRNSANEITRIK